MEKRYNQNCFYIFEINNRFLWQKYEMKNVTQKYK